MVGTLVHRQFGGGGASSVPLFGVVDMLPTAACGFAQESWGVRMELNWRHDTSNDSDDGHRQGVIDTFWKAWEIRLNELCSMVEACAGATELVEGLRALHIPMAIATSSRMDSVSKKKLR